MQNRDTIICTKRSNRPRVFVAVCQKCRYSKRCPAYQKYINPTLFEQKRRRKRRKARRQR